MSGHVEHCSVLISWNASVISIYIFSGINEVWQGAQHIAVLVNKYYQQHVMHWKLELFACTHSIHGQISNLKLCLWYYKM